MKTECPVCEQLNNDLDNFEKTQLDCNPVFAKTHSDIIELIDLYWVDRYRDHAFDSLGFLRPFYNVIESPTQVASKMVDLDTKDIRIIAEEGQSYYPVWLFEKDLKIWMKEQKFGQLLNKIVYNWPKYGTVVLKKAKSKVYMVPLQNLKVEPTAESLVNAKYVIEEHDYSPAQLREQPWNNIEDAIDEFEEGGHIKVWEYFGRVEDMDGNYFIIATSDKARKQKRAILLHQDEKKIEDIYKELHWDKIPGRWLGRGQPEKLFHTQIYQNKIANYKAHGAHWTSKHIYQTRDSRIAGNLLVDIEDGEIIITNDQLSPVQMEERNLSFYREEEMRWDELMDRRTFSRDIIRGERPPSGTPLGSAILATKMAGGYFDLKREDLGLFLKELFYDWIIPEFKKGRKGIHKLMLSEFDEDEVEKLRRLIANHRVNKALVGYIARTGRIPGPREKELLKALAWEGIKRHKDIDIPKGYYDNLKYKINIIITSEQIDLASKMATLQTVMAMLAQNPTILQDKRTRKIFYQLLDLAGISPIQFDEEEPSLGGTLEQIQPAKRGGSMARIPPVVTPQQTQTATTL